MKISNILRILTAISAGATAISAFDVTSLVPAQYTPVLLGVTLAIKAVKEVAVVAGDYLDNGKRDGSFNCAPLAFLAAGALAVLGMTSCGVVETKPDGTRIEKKPDNTTIGLVVGLGLKVLDYFTPAPVAVPVTPVVPAK